MGKYRFTEGPNPSSCSPKRVTWFAGIPPGCRDIYRDMLLYRDMRYIFGHIAYMGGGGGGDGTPKIISPLFHAPYYTCIPELNIVTEEFMVTEIISLNTLV